MQHGFEQIPATLKRLFTGANLGKQLLKVGDAPLPVRSSALAERGFKLMSSFAAWR